MTFFNLENKRRGIKSKQSSISIDSIDEDEDLPAEPVTFDHNQAIDSPERLIQNKKPKKGDLISFFHAEKNCWVNAKITKDLSRKWKDYYNIVYDDKTEDGLYLKKDTRWTFADPPADALEIPRSHLEDSHSLKPTPEATLSHLSETDNQAHLLSDRSNVSNPNSLDWDLLGTGFQPSLNPSENPFNPYRRKSR